MLGGVARYQLCYKVPGVVERFKEVLDGARWCCREPGGVASCGAK